MPQPRQVRDGLGLDSMASDTFISWLIHSDWYLIGGWILVLAVAVLVTFTDLPRTLLRSRDSEAGNPPQRPDEVVVFGRPEKENI